VEIKNLKNGKSKTAIFNFDLKDKAPVNEKYSIPFKINDNNGKVFYKFIDIIITPPDKYELIQNYPNPFNPSTTISYIIPVKSFVNISVINILGEQLKILLMKKNFLVIIRLNLMRQI